MELLFSLFVINHNSLFLWIHLLKCFILIMNTNSYDLEKTMWNGLNFSYLFCNNIILTKHELRTQSYILVSNKENTCTKTACFSRTSIHVCIILGLGNVSFTSITHFILHSTHIVFEMLTSFYFLTYVNFQVPGTQTSEFLKLSVCTWI